MITLFVSTGKKKVTVNYDGNGGSVSRSSDICYANETYGDLPSATRSGYSFNGWFTSADGGMPVSSSTEPISNNSHTLYAHWSKSSCTVSLNANGGKVSPASIGVTKGRAYSDLPLPTKEGYSFRGWYTAASGGSRI